MALCVRVQAIGAILRYWPQLDLVDSLLSSLLALFVPLIILTVCNVCLIRALQQSRRLQSQCRASCRSEAGVMAAGGRAATGSGNNGQQRITPTLVALIVVFTVCVGPSGLLEKCNTVLERRIFSSLTGSVTGFCTICITTER